MNETVAEIIERLNVLGGEAWPILVRGKAIDGVMMFTPLILVIIVIMIYMYGINRLEKRDKDPDPDFYTGFRIGGVVVGAILILTTGAFALCGVSQIVNPEYMVLQDIINF